MDEIHQNLTKWEKEANALHQAKIDQLFKDIEEYAKEIGMTQEELEEYLF